MDHCTQCGLPMNVCMCFKPQGQGMKEAKKVAKTVAPATVNTPKEDIKPVFGAGEVKTDEQIKKEEDKRLADEQKSENK